MRLSGAFHFQPRAMPPLQAAWWKLLSTIRAQSAGKRTWLNKVRLFLHAVVDGQVGGLRPSSAPCNVWVLTNCCFIKEQVHNTTTTPTTHCVFWVISITLSHFCAGSPAAVEHETPVVSHPDPTPGRVAGRGTVTCTASFYSLHIFANIKPSNPWAAVWPPGGSLHVLQALLPASKLRLWFWDPDTLNIQPSPMDA